MNSLEGVGTIRQTPRVRAETLLAALLVPSDTESRPWSVRCVALALGISVPAAGRRIRAARQAGLLTVVVEHDDTDARMVIRSHDLRKLRHLVRDVDPTHPAFSPEGGLGAEGWLALALVRAGIQVPGWLSSVVDRVRNFVRGSRRTVRRSLSRWAGRLGLDAARDRAAREIADERRQYHDQAKRQQVADLETTAYNLTAAEDGGWDYTSSHLRVRHRVNGLLATALVLIWGLIAGPLLRLWRPRSAEAVPLGWLLTAADELEARAEPRRL